MTLQKLNRYFELRERLGKSKEMLASFQSAVYPGAQVLTGMPHAPGISDKVGNLAVEITDMENAIQSLINEIGKDEAEITAYITSIEDEQLRMIFRLRFLRCLTWEKVALLIGGRNTASSVKNACYRYLETCDAPGGVVLDVTLPPVV